MHGSTRHLNPEFAHTIKRIGIISRDYNTRYPNGYRDFSHVLPDVLQLLHTKGCDTALFSLFSIVPRKGYDLRSLLPKETTLRMICIEEFRDCRTGRKAGAYVVYYRMPDGWHEYRFKQAFGKVNWQCQQEKIRQFAAKELPRRIIGNGCIILCGESNGVKYDKTGSQGIVDTCGVRAALPPSVDVILNPVHDRMSRFEMVRKRQFLSLNRKVVVSVWNKGKQNCQGQVKDGTAPAWTVFYDGLPVEVPNIATPLGVEMACVTIPLHQPENKEQDAVNEGKELFCERDACAMRCIEIPMQGKSTLHL